MLLNYTSVVMILNRNRGGMGPENTGGLLYIKPPMIYKALRVMLLMRAASITWASGRGLGPRNLNFRLEAILQGPKKSQFPGPNPLHLPS
jgi:hypothetical protein